MSFLKSYKEVDDDLIDKLIKAGIKTSVDLLTADLEILAQETSHSYRELQSIKQLLRAQHAALPITGNELYMEAIRHTTVHATCSESLNKALDGGLLSGEIIELLVSDNTIYIKLCMQMAILKAAKKKKVLYFDCSSLVQPNLLINMFNDLQLEPTEDRLRRISFCFPQHIWEVISTLETKSTDMIILDSLTSLVMSVASACDQGIGALWQLASTLRQVTSKYHIATILVSHSTDVALSAESSTVLSRLPHIQVVLENSEKGGVFKISKATRLPLMTTSLPL